MSSYIFISIFILSSLSLASDLESLINGTATTDEQVALSQQTRLSEAIQSQLKVTTADQNIFLRYIEKQDWKKSFISWSKAFNGTPFEKTENGKALSAYVIFKSGLEITGLEKLFTIIEPKNINTEITHSWKEANTEENPIWEVAKIEWNDGWTQVFGRSSEVKSRLRQIDLKTSTSMLTDMASKLAANTKERALVDWQLALSYALNDKADEAAKLIGQLLKNKKSPYSEDLVNLTAGRLLFQKGYFEASAKYYEKILKKSDYWLEAQEELAWSYLRKGETQNSVAISKTLMNVAFDGYLGPEPYFVETLGRLKVCDYPKVMEGLKQFPKKFKSRTVELDKLAKGEKVDFLDSIVNKIKTEKMTWSNMGKDMSNLPRAMIKDYKLIQLISAQNLFEKESLVSDNLYADTLALTGLQGDFQILKNSTTSKKIESRSATVQRIKDLARIEVAETKKILDKLQIVEAELVSQIDLSGQIIKDSTKKEAEIKKGSMGLRKTEALVFPAESEIWFDELSNYNVDVKKGCQAIKR